MYKIQNSLVPNYLQQIVPTNTAQNYQLRNSRNLTLPYCRTERYRLSFVPRTVCDWNSLPADIKCKPSYSVFKKVLKNKLFSTNTNKLFHFGISTVNKQHTRLRLGLSPLRGHLFKYHIIDSNICQFCLSEGETTDHYFLKCRNFNTQRVYLYISLFDILGDVIININDDNLVKMLLYGSDQLSIEKNKELFQAVHTFISKTKRFNCV